MPLNVLLRAPTAMNIQPWLFGVVKDKATLSKIAAMTDNGRFIADCPLCFAVFGEKNQKYYLEDCCAATENLILALQAHGVSSCWVAGEKKPYAEEVRKLLGFPGNIPWYPWSQPESCRYCHHPEKGYETYCLF